MLVEFLIRTWIISCLFKNITQVDRLKVEDCQGKAHFEAMFGAKIRHFRQSTAIVIF